MHSTIIIYTQAMIVKNFLRRKGRTLLTVLGIAIGVLAIITLGALGISAHQAADVRALLELANRRVP